MQITQAFSSFSVKDIAEAKKFFGETLELVVEEKPEGLELKLPKSLSVFIYLSPTNKPADYTVLNFIVDDVETSVEELNTKGIQMEQYTGEYIKTDAKGISHNNSGMGPKAMAWFKDPSGNILALMQQK